MWQVKFLESTKYSPKTIVLMQGRWRMSQSPRSNILITEKKISSDEKPMIKGSIDRYVD